jgi:hypothetical protein
VQGFRRLQNFSPPPLGCSEAQFIAAVAEMKVRTRPRVRVAVPCTFLALVRPLHVFSPRRRPLHVASFRNVPCIYQQDLLPPPPLKLSTKRCRLCRCRAARAAAYKLQNSALGPSEPEGPARVRVLPWDRGPSGHENLPYSRSKIFRKSQGRFSKSQGRVSK